MAVKMRNLDEDGAGIVVAMPHDHGRHTRGGTPAQVGFDPDFGLQSHAGGLRVEPLAHKNSIARRLSDDGGTAGCGQAAETADERPRYSPALGHVLVRLELANGPHGIFVGAAGYLAGIVAEG